MGTFLLGKKGVVSLQPSVRASLNTWEGSQALRILLSNPCTNQIALARGGICFEVHGAGGRHPCPLVLVELQVSDAGAILGSQILLETRIWGESGSSTHPGWLTGVLNRIKNLFAERPRFPTSVLHLKAFPSESKHGLSPGAACGRLSTINITYQQCSQPQASQKFLLLPRSTFQSNQTLFFPLMSVDTYWKTLQRNPQQTNSSGTSTFYKFLLSYFLLFLLLLLFYFISLLCIENMVFSTQECICSCNLGYD